MYIWKLTETLTNPEDPEWEVLLKTSFKEEVHPERKKGFLLSREALRSCLKQAGIETSPAELKLSNYSKVKKFLQFTVSLTHTKNCGAALLADRETYASVGIDVEHEERVVKDLVRERIAHREDESLRNIELWSLKEAAFKALMNSEKFEVPVEFSSIRIGKEEWVHSPSGLKGEWKLEKSGSFIIALAFLKS